jgi:hypothetical protein
VQRDPDIEGGGDDGRLAWVALAACFCMVGLYGGRGVRLW